MKATMQHGSLRKAFASKDDFFFLAALLWMTSGFNNHFEPPALTPA